jgi:hypothetical protein
MFEIAMSTAKQDVEKLLKSLPDNVSVEDIQYHIYVLDKVRRGLEDARVSGALSQEEVSGKVARILQRVGKGNSPVEGDELPPEFAAKKKRST